MGELLITEKKIYALATAPPAVCTTIPGRSLKSMASSISLVSESTVITSCSIADFYTMNNDNFKKISIWKN